MATISEERLAKIAAGSAEDVYFGWPQKLVAEEAQKLARSLLELREGFRVHDAGWKASNVINERWRLNSVETWEAMQSMRNSINEHIPMPSIEGDLLQGSENSVFCATVAEAVIQHVTELQSLRSQAGVSEPVGYVRPDTLQKLRDGDAGPIAGVPAFDTTIPLFARPAPIEITEEMVERACVATDPLLFSEDQMTAHMAASPLKVECVQNLVRSKLRAALTAAFELDKQPISGHIQRSEGETK